MAPNRMTAYQNARAAAKPQKGLTYSELLMDNIIGLDNDYLSAGERLGQQFNADEIGFLKNAGISAYEGAKKAVTQPLTTAEELLSGLYDSGVDIASTLGTDPTYLDDALREMYGVGYDEATDEQVNRAREALFGDVLNVASVVPVGRALDAAVIAPVDRAIDRANINEAVDFRIENSPEYDPSALAGRRMYVPDFFEKMQMSKSTPTPGEAAYMSSISDADYLESLGYSPEAISNATGILDIPMRRVGENENVQNLRVAAVPEEVFDAYRQKRPNVDVKFYKGSRGMAGYGAQKVDSSGYPVLPYEYEIGISTGLRSPQDKQDTFDHEMTHIDLMEGDVTSDAVGGNPDAMNLDRIYSLKAITDAMKNATPEERDELRALKREIQEMTPREFYYNNPGEMLARLSESGGEGTFSAKRLTALQTLNPYLNPKSLPKRVVEAGLTTLFSDTRPYMAYLQRAGNALEQATDNVPLLNKVPLYPRRGYDVHEKVPMDLNKAVLPPRQGRGNYYFSEGGIVKGSYLDNDPYD